MSKAKGFKQASDIVAGLFRKLTLKVSKNPMLCVSPNIDNTKCALGTRVLRLAMQNPTPCTRGQAAAAIAILLLGNF